MLKWGVARWSDAAATGLFQPNGVVAQFPKIFKFPGFKPYLFASLVSGATYAQTGTTVTVTATGHGLPNNKNGYRIYWPASAAIAAGWYENFQYVDANTYTFANPAPQTIPAGSAITGTLPITTLTQGPVAVLPGGSVGPTGCLLARIARSGDATAGTKALRMFVGPSVCSVSLLTSSALVVGTMSAMATGSNNLIGGFFGGVDGAINNSIGNTLTASADLTKDQPVEFRFQLANASQWLCLDAAFLEAIL